MIGLRSLRGQAKEDIGLLLGVRQVLALELLLLLGALQVELFALGQDFGLEQLPLFLSLNGFVICLQFFLL